MGTGNCVSADQPLGADEPSRERQTDQVDYPQIRPISPNFGLRNIRCPRIARRDIVQLCPSDRRMDCAKFLTRILACWSHVTANRIGSHGSQARAKTAAITLDTDLAGRSDAFNPAEVLLASLPACILKGAERVIPMLKFDLREIEVSLHGLRQDSLPKLIRITCAIVVDSDETDQRLDLLHRNLQKYGTIYTTLAAATDLVGTIRRKA